MVSNNNPPPLPAQDSGQEVRGPIDPVVSLIAANGHFFVVQEGIRAFCRCCGDVAELTLPPTLRALGVDAKAAQGWVMCAGGVQGYARGSYAHFNVLLLTLGCAAVRECIAPAGASIFSHRFDQSVFSIHIHRAQLHCQRETRFWAKLCHPVATALLNSRDNYGRDVILLTRNKFSGYSPFSGDVKKG